MVTWTAMLASELSEIISIFEAAIETGLELANQLEAGDLSTASEIYRVSPCLSTNDFGGEHTH